MSELKDLTGKKFGRLTVISRAPNNSQDRAMWNCVCDCGKTKTTLGVSLRQGKAKSCGCIRAESNTKRLTKHGYAALPEYTVWLGMKQRCYNLNNKEFHNYGARGISICKRWQSFKNFIKDMGDRPGKTFMIERIDNNKGYSPDNCKWATPFEQANNKRTNVFIHINGCIKTATQWGRIAGIKASIIYDRISRGWEPEKAVFQPIIEVQRSNVSNF